MAGPNGAGPRARGRGVLFLVGGRYLCSACKGMAAANTASPLDRATGVLHCVWLLPMECVRGMAVSYGKGPLARGTGNPDEWALAANGAPTGDCSP